MSSSELKSIDFKIKWTFDDVEQFNRDICDSIINSGGNSDSNSSNYDSIIYFASCHGDRDSVIYDKNGEIISLTYVTHVFDNQNCKALRQKPKMYLFDTNRVSSKESYVNSNAGDALADEKNSTQEKTNESQNSVTSTSKSKKRTDDNGDSKDDGNELEMMMQSYTKENYCRNIFGNVAQHIVPLSNKKWWNFSTKYM